MYEIFYLKKTCGNRDEFDMVKNTKGEYVSGMKVVCEVKKYYDELY